MPDVTDNATNKETLSIICKSSTSGYRHYSTKESGATTKIEAKPPPPQGDDCSHYNP